MDKSVIPNIEIRGDDFVVLNHPTVIALKKQERNERNKIWTRGWRIRNKAHHNDYQRKYRIAHPIQMKGYHKKYYLLNKEKMALTETERIELRLTKKQIKLECLNAYSNNLHICACCGENQDGFLTIDHKNNDGHLDKGINAKKRMGGNYLYGYLKKRGFPNKDKYQVLCWNCNCGKGINGGVCPHKTVNA